MTRRPLPHSESDTDSRLVRRQWSRQTLCANSEGCQLLEHNCDSSPLSLGAKAVFNYKDADVVEQIQRVLGRREAALRLKKVTAHFSANDIYKAPSTHLGIYVGEALIVLVVSCIGPSRVPRPLPLHLEEL